MLFTTADSLVGRVFDEMRRRGPAGLVAEAVGSTAGIPRLVSLTRYAKAPARKKPPKPPIKRVHDPKKPHVTLSRLLAAQKAAAP